MYKNRLVKFGNQWNYYDGVIVCCTACIHIKTPFLNELHKIIDLIHINVVYRISTISEDALYINENGLQQAVENDVQLEDFFWTGSGDGPPSYVRRPIVPSNTDNGPTIHNAGAGAGGGATTIIKTATVVATVYVGDNDVSVLINNHVLI